MPRDHDQHYVTVASRAGSVISHELTTLYPLSALAVALLVIEGVLSPWSLIIAAVLFAIAVSGD